MGWCHLWVAQTIPTHRADPRPSFWPWISGPGLALLVAAFSQSPAVWDRGRMRPAPSSFWGFSKQIHGLRGAFVHAGFNSGPPGALGVHRNVALGASSWAMRFGSILWLARSQTHANPRVGFEEASQSRRGVRTRPCAPCRNTALCSAALHAILWRNSPQEEAEATPNSLPGLTPLLHFKIF